MFNYPSPSVHDSTKDHQTGLYDDNYVSVLVVPDFIERALVAGLANNADTMNYEQSRRVINMHDYALWLGIQDACKLSHNGDPLHIHSAYNTSNVHAELTNVVRPLSNTEDIIQAANEYLNQAIESEGSGDEELTTQLDSIIPRREKPKFFYQFKSIGETVLLIVQPGFLTHLQHPDDLLEFLREWVKELGKIVSPDRLACHAMFRLYLSCLRRKISTS